MQIWLGLAQNHNANVLQEELHDDPQDDQRCNDLAQTEEAKQDGHATEIKQRDVREMARRVKLAEDLKKVSVASRCKRNAGVAKQKREYAGEGRDHHQHCRQSAECGPEPTTVGNLHEVGHKSLPCIQPRRSEQWLPRNDCEDGGVQSDIEDSYHTD